MAKCNQLTALPFKGLNSADLLTLFLGSSFYGAVQLRLSRQYDVRWDGNRWKDRYQDYGTAGRRKRRYV